MTLEEAIQDIAARGLLTHCSLVPSQNGRMWRGSFTSSKTGVSIAEDADPIKALLGAIKTAKPRVPISLNVRENAYEKVRTENAVIPQDTVEVAHDEEVEALM